LRHGVVRNLHAWHTIKKTLFKKLVQVDLHKELACLTCFLAQVFSSIRLLVFCVSFNAASFSSCFYKKFARTCIKIWLRKLAQISWTYVRVIVLLGNGTLSRADKCLSHASAMLLCYAAWLGFKRINLDLSAAIEATVGSLSRVGNGSRAVTHWFNHINVSV